MSFDRRSRGAAGGGEADARSAGTPGKRTLTANLEVQRKAESAAPEKAVHAAAERGVSGASTALPHLDRVQRLFGRHDVSGIQAHTDGAAAEGAQAMGARAFATGDHVAFAGAPDLHTAAHEAAHIVQQRRGVQLKGGVGQAGDVYEQHADAVADAVVAGRSAEALLDGHAGSGVDARGGSTAIQRITDEELKARGARIKEKAKTAPTSGMNLWVASSAKPEATIYLLGTNHGLRLTQMVEWKALVAFLQSVPFTHVLSETTAEFDRNTMPGVALGAIAMLENKLKVEKDFNSRFPGDQPQQREGVTRGQAIREHAFAKQTLNNEIGKTGKLDSTGLDDAYVALGLTSGRNPRPGRGYLDGDGRHEQATSDNMKDLGIPAPPDPKAFEKGQEDPKYLEEREKYLKGIRKVRKGSDEPVSSDEDVKTGNQRSLFEEQAEEMLAGRDIANAEQRNKLWVDRLKAPENLKEGDRQLWIVGAAHLPGLILRFEDLQWNVVHHGPLLGGEDSIDDQSSSNNSNPTPSTSNVKEVD